MLWYKGKKKNDSTLVLSNGSTVVWHAGKGDVTLQTSTGGPFSSLEKGLDQTGQEEQELTQIANADENGSRNYPIVQAATQAYEYEKAIFQQVAAKGLPVPAPDVAPLSSITSACPADQVVYERIMNYVKEHRNDKTYNGPEPPPMDYEHCWSCDPQRQVDYDTTVARYVRAFFATEAGLVQECIRLIRKMYGIGLNKDAYDPSNPADKAVLDLLGSPQHPTPCTWMGEAYNKLPEALVTLHLIARNKAETVFRRYYKTDEHRVRAILQLYLTACQAYILASGSSAEEDAELSLCGEAAYFIFSRLTDKLFHQRDYTMLANIPLLFGACRDLVLLTNSRTTDDNFIKDFFNFDRFKLTLDVDCKMGGEGMYQLAHLKGDNYIRALPADSGSGPQHCVKWVVLNKTSSNLKLNLAAGDVIAPAEARPTYIGTHDWYSLAPSFFFHSCDQGEDTLIIHEITPVGFKEMWQVPRIGPMDQPIIRSLLMSCFLDKDKLQEQAAQLQANQGALEAQMQAKIQKIQQEMAKAGQAGQSGQATNAQQMASMSKMMSMSDEIKQSMDQYAPSLPGNYMFEVHLHNGDKMMINEKIDGKKLFPDNSAIVFANFSIQVVQDSKTDIGDPMSH
jgi:hypothetical protein